MSADDYELRRVVWDSRLPVEFRLDQDDRLALGRGSGDSPRALHESAFVRSLPQFGKINDIQGIKMQLARVSYFPVGLNKALHQVLSGGGSGGDLLSNVWLQLGEGGPPLKWWVGWPQNQKPLEIGHI